MSLLEEEMTDFSSSIVIKLFSLKFSFILKTLRIDNTKKLIKPFKPYNNYEFEYIFEFGPNCRNYDKNKILDITNCII